MTKTVKPNIKTILPVTSLYDVTERDCKVRATYARFDRLLCIGITEGYDGMALHRVVDVSWYRSQSAKYPSIKNKNIIYCHLYVKGVGHSWGYCGGSVPPSHKSTVALQEALEKMGVIMHDENGVAFNLGGRGADYVLSVVKALAYGAEPNLLAMEVFD